MIRATLSVDRIPKGKTFAGKPRKDGSIPKYLAIVLFENRDGPDQYGNDGFIALDVTKEQREAGEKGPIIGNWKHVGKKPAAPQQRPSAPKAAPRQKDADLDPQNEDDIPF